MVPIRSLPEVLEVKRTLTGGEMHFPCRLVVDEGDAAVLLFVSPVARVLHGLRLDAGTVTFGYFFRRRPYNVYHLLTPAGQTIAFYFNLSDQTVIAPGRVEWRDLTVDVLATPAGRLEVLDESELPLDLDLALREPIEAGKADLLRAPAALTAEIEARSRALWARAFPPALDAACDPRSEADKRGR